MSPDNASGRPGLVAATSVQGDPVLIKTWPVSGKKDRSVLEEIWRNEIRQLHRLAGYPGADDYIAALVDAGSDSAGFHLVLSPGQRQPLAMALRHLPAVHWLRSPRQASSRAQLWANLARIAAGLETLHAQGILHRNMDEWSVLTSGGEVPDFQLTGFEWSMRLVGAGSQGIGRGPKARKAADFDSFAKDWVGFAKLAATVLGVDGGRLQDAAVPPYELAEHLLIEEARLLKLISRGGQETRLDGEVVSLHIEQVLAQLAAVSARVEAKLFLTLRLGPGAALSDRIRDATGGVLEADDIEGQVAFVRADISQSLLLLAVKSQDVTVPFRLVMRGHNLVYSLSAYRPRSSSVPTWEFAYCERADAKAPAAANVLGSYSCDPGTVEVMALGEAGQRFPRLRGKLRSWEEIRVKFQTETEPESPERQFKKGLALLSFLEVLLAAADIFPVEVIAPVDDGDGGTHEVSTLRLRPAGDAERDALSSSLGLQTPSSRLVAALVGDRGADDRAQKEGWRLTDSGSLGERMPTDTDWRFARVQEGAASPDTFVFAGDNPGPGPCRAFLVQGGSVGRGALFRRRQKALEALGKHRELLRMLADPRSRIMDSHDELVEDDAFSKLDEPKQTALRKLTGTLPLFLVQGPPGVGKTHLVRNLVSRRFGTDPTSRLLLSAQSNAALDHLLEELEQVLPSGSPDAPMVVRCRPREKDETDGPFDISVLSGEILGRLRNSQLAKAAPPVMRAKLEMLAPSPGLAPGRRKPKADARGNFVQTEPREFALRAFESAVVRAANIVFATTNSAELERLIDERGQFDWAIVEEAGKATGGELLSPMLLSHRRLMIGDHKQLPPFGSERMIELLGKPDKVRSAIATGREFVARWLRDATTDEILDEVDEEQEPGDLPSVCGEAIRALMLFETIIDAEFARQSRSPSGRPIAARLTEQHRMHPAIASLVSDAFYDGLLVTADTARNSFRDGRPPHSWLVTGCIPLSPVTVVDMPYLQSTIGKTRGNLLPRWHNPDEVEAVRLVLSQLRADPDCSARPRLAILSPYAEQVRRLAAMVETEFPGSKASLCGFLPALPGYCGTVDAFQGNEAEVVIVSLVRNNDHQGPLAALGFLREANRMNVLLSRAKWQMVLVASLEFLRTVVNAAATVEDRRNVSAMRKVLAWLDRPPEEYREHVATVGYDQLTDVGA